MITVEKASEGRRARPFFQLFRREHRSEVYSRKAIGNEVGCYRCHTNGPKAIAPRPPISEDVARAVSEVNRQMASYGPMEWSRVRPENLGPGFGQTNPARPRTQATIEACATKNRIVSYIDQNFRNSISPVFQMSSSPRIRWQKVRDAMNCAMCHDGVQRAPVYNGMETMSTLGKKILVERSMPPTHDDLTPDERIALVICLEIEAPAELARWLTEVSCDLVARASPSPAAQAISERERAPVVTPAGSTSAETTAQPARQPQFFFLKSALAASPDGPPVPLPPFGLK